MVGGVVGRGRGGEDGEVEGLCGGGFVSGVDCGGQRAEGLGQGSRRRDGRFRLIGGWEEGEWGC